MRRNILIAQTLSRSSLRPAILLIAGAPEARALLPDSRLPCLTLPALTKNGNGHYEGRSADLRLAETIALRAHTIKTALEAFRPHIFIVDNVPRGAVRELDHTLEYLRASGEARCVLGLRDVLDDPTRVAYEWAKAANGEAIRNYYDEVWVYGDPRVYDPVREYRLPSSVAVKFRYVGYLDQLKRLEFGDLAARAVAQSLVPATGRLMLCLCGGGQDGAAMVRAFTEACLPPDATGVVVTGPHMAADERLRLHHTAVLRSNLRVADFLPEPAWLVARADRIVAMGGYNTVGEVLCHGKRALIVPRTAPRREQWIRAKRLQAMGFVDLLPSDQLSAGALSKWLAAETAPPASARTQIDFGALEHLPALAEALLNSSSCAAAAR